VMIPVLVVVIVVVLTHAALPQRTVPSAMRSAVADPDGLSPGAPAAGARLGQLVGRELPRQARSRRYCERGRGGRADHGDEVPSRELSPR
jgi:hypothetical protein